MHPAVVAALFKKGKIMIKIMRLIERQPAPDERDEGVWPFVIADQVTDEVGFRELVQLMRDFAYPSTSHPSGSVFEWLMSEPSQDYRTGDEIQESLHFAHENHPRAAKYWGKAMKASGFIK